MNTSLKLALFCIIAFGTTGLAQTPAQAERVRAVLIKAEQGDADAQLRMGNTYFFGIFVQINGAEAAKWYQRAANQGQVIAQGMLGQLYQYDKNWVEAYMWFDLSAKQGNADSAKSRDDVKARMSLTQLSEAQLLSKNWKPKSER